MRCTYKTLPFMVNGAMEDYDQDVYGALEKKKNWEKHIKQKLGKWNVETKKAGTNNTKTADLQTN